MAKEETAQLALDSRTERHSRTKNYKPFELSRLVHASILYLYLFYLAIRES
jgi:hypothetical protein